MPLSYDSPRTYVPGRRRPKGFACCDAQHSKSQCFDMLCSAAWPPLHSRAPASHFHMFLLPLRCRVSSAAEGVLARSLSARTQSPASQRIFQSPLQHRAAVPVASAPVAVCCWAVIVVFESCEPAQLLACILPPCARLDQRVTASLAPQSVAEVSACSGEGVVGGVRHEPCSGRSESGDLLIAQSGVEHCRTPTVDSVPRANAGPIRSTQPTCTACTYE